MSQKWRWIAGFENLYEISSGGKARSVARIVVGANGVSQRIKSRELSPNWVGKGRYAYLHLYKHKNGKKARTVKYLHQAVLEAFVGPRPNKNHEACHGPLGCYVNTVENLRWDTRKENLKDVVLYGVQRGERNPASKLTAQKVISIRKRFSTGETARAIAAEFGLSHDYIYTIINRKAWKHVL